MENLHVLDKPYSGMNCSTVDPAFNVSESTLQIKLPSLNQSTRETRLGADWVNIKICWGPNPVSALGIMFLYLLIPHSWWFHRTKLL